MTIIDKIEKIIDDLLSETNFLIILRPHPADRRFDKWQKIASNYGLKFSNVRLTNSFDFLCKVDLIISGDSNIHLEAATMNVTSIYFDSSSLCLDWYGFKKNGLIEYSENIDLILGRIRELTYDRKNISHYVSTSYWSYYYDVLCYDFIKKRKYDRI